MFSRTLAASAFAVLCLSGAPTAFAADIYDNERGPKVSSPYDDPRYDDVYRRPRHPYAAEPRYDYRDRPHDVDPYAGRRHYSEPSPEAYDGTHCVPRYVIRKKLHSDGWTDFHALDLRDETVALIRARRPDGRLYDLKVDRCTGDVLHSRLVDGHDGRYGYNGYRDKYNGYHDRPGPYADRYRYGERRY